VYLGSGEQGPAYHLTERLGGDPQIGVLWELRHGGVLARVVPQDRETALRSSDYGGLLVGLEGKRFLAAGLSDDSAESVGRNKGMALLLDLDRGHLVAAAYFQVRRQECQYVPGRDQLDALQNGLRRSAGHDVPGQRQGFL